MKRKNLLKLVGAIVLALVISIAFLPGCAKEAPAPAPAPAAEVLSGSTKASYRRQTHHTWLRFCWPTE